jgi:hypothetical protein
MRKTSKADSQRRWLQKEENRSYFRGPDHVERVQRWRETHAGYWRRAKHRPVALQDDIAKAARRMQQLGNDILYPQHKGGGHGKTLAVPPAAAQTPTAVQLDRPAPGARAAH